MELFIADKEISLKEAIQRIDRNGKKILFLVKEDNALAGVLTDGDIRRWILKSGDLDVPVKRVMNLNPVVVFDPKDASDKMIYHNVFAIPFLDNQKKIKKIFFAEDFNRQEVKRKSNLIDIPVVIMAGGEGQRLYPYTKILPKPLIPIGDTPIIERIMNRFCENGCHKFYLTVNYKKNMIKSYFAENKRSFDIHFVEETTPLGTAGSLSLLGENIENSFFVSNCDILIEANYKSIYEYHKNRENKITIVTSLQKNIIPYGVVSIDERSDVCRIDEKPETHILVNTGMYLLESELIKHIPKDETYHMTDLIKYCIENNLRVGTYPIRETAWLDMGQLKEMDIMIRKLASQDAE